MKELERNNVHLFGGRRGKKWVDELYLYAIGILVTLEGEKDDA